MRRPPKKKICIKNFINFNKFDFMSIYIVFMSKIEIRNPIHPKSQASKLRTIEKVWDSCVVWSNLWLKYKYCSLWDRIAIRILLKLSIDPQNIDYRPDAHTHTCQKLANQFPLFSQCTNIEISFHFIFSDLLQSNIQFSIRIHSILRIIKWDFPQNSPNFNIQTK